MKKLILSSSLALLVAALICVPPPTLGGVGQGSDTNTKNGNNALQNNTTGFNNSAYGVQALFSNTTGSDNTGVGFQALYSHIEGIFNCALGSQALFSFTSDPNGGRNCAFGGAALFSLTNGDSNTAVGTGSLAGSVAVNFNTAVGRRALFRTQADQNIGLGFFAGSNLRDGGTNDIYIGNVGPDPIGTESNTIRIGTQTPTTATGPGNPPLESHAMPAHTDTYIAGIFGAATTLGVPVYVDATGKLGTIPSSQRFKDEIKPMDKASEAILSLRPVTFRYKKEIDPKKVPQFGLVAEEVAKINPDLVARDGKGEIYSVRYEAVNAMLLNEFLKEHRKVQELEAARIAEQKEIAELKQQLKAQAAAIQKVSDRVELNRPSAQIVDNR